MRTSHVASNVCNLSRCSRQLHSNHSMQTKKTKYLVLTVLMVLSAAECFVYPSFGGQGIEKRGLITEDETWEGEIHAARTVEVKQGVTLTILPGTVVKFHHDRNYKTFDRAALIVYGTIKAIGTPQKQIWFTSDAPEPINGDWLGIRIFNSEASVLDHVIVEYGELGVSQLNSSVPITNSIIRWNNSEGLYAERSTPRIMNNTLYGNAYHEIALEQYNKDALIKNNLFRDGQVAIHHEKSSSIIEDNYFKNYRQQAVSAGMQSNITVRHNTFENIGQKPEITADGADLNEKNNRFAKGREPLFDYLDVKRTELGYLPGDEGDKFPYIYAEEDETRRIVKKIGEGLSFGWSLAYAKNSLWRFSIGHGEVGKELDFIRVNPETGAFVRFGNNEIISPRGLAFDGECFYVNDGSLVKIFKFKLKKDAKAGDFIEIVDRFDIPEKEKGGTAGLACDGDLLYLISRDGNKIHKLDKSGKRVGEINFCTPGGAITWTGEYFWVYGGGKKGLCKITKEGKLVGEIYLPAKDPWALAWDGKYLWTLQRTNENWEDPKIYQVEILDDSLK